MPGAVHNGIFPRKERMMGEQNWNVEKNLPLRDIVFRRIRRAILRGELAPGQRLMEMKLADKMGVSRTPVREAIDRKSVV